MRLLEDKQSALFNDETSLSYGIFPSTRYQGSKKKILKWIEFYTRDLEFNTVLDAFGGTGSVAYMYKKMGKQVFYNDYLNFNYIIGLALIENDDTFLAEEDIKSIITEHPEIKYPSFIFETFHDIYFTDEENRWLDMVITNIRNIKNIKKRALAYFALFQACIIKRPYNLFHRKNLYVRFAKVRRSFGNKKTWDTSFRDFFLRFAQEANNAVFRNSKINKAFQKDIFELDIDMPDLVYIDTPYISKNGVGVDYFDFYHFLEGIMNYDNWEDMIDTNSKHKKIKNGKNEWCRKEEIHRAFEKLFLKFRESIIITSYRDDGIPSIEELRKLLRGIGKKVSVKKLEYKYALSNKKSKEVLIIAQ